MRSGFGASNGGSVGYMLRPWLRIKSGECVQGGIGRDRARVECWCGVEESGDVSGVLQGLCAVNLGKWV